MDDSDEESDRSLGKRTKKETNPVKAVDSDDANKDFRSKPTVVSSGPVHKSRQETNNSESESDEDLSASFANESDEGPPPPFSALVVEYQQPKPAATPAPIVRAASTWQHPLQSTARKSDSGDSSIDSQSDDFVQSIEDDAAAEIKQPLTVKKLEPAPAYGEASESGVYEEEAFDEESVAPESISTPALIVRVDPVPADTTKNEPNFDYSMDFSDDDVDANSAQAKGPSPLQAITPTALEHHSEEDASKSQSLDGNSENEQSEFLESDGEAPNERGQPEDDNENKISSEVQEITPSDVSPGTEMPEAAGNRVSHAEQEEEFKQLNPAGQIDHSRVTSTRATSTLGPTNRVKPPVVAPSTRQRVVIIREYEQMDGEKPEMKDASTQFTGNHAGIQAELVPEGMHNLFPRSSILPEQQQQSPNCSPESTNIRPTGSSSSPTLPPLPPQTTAPSLSVENCGYSMDPIHSYSVSSTSVYKQQLLDLQRQIQLKKQETEKLVRDRMAFQYSSFRGTERVRISSKLAKHNNLQDLTLPLLVCAQFLDTNRPARMQLWEALMRVDPMLDEAKAREIARLTGSHTGS